MLKRREWAILIYLAAHNNLERLGQRSLNQIANIRSSPQLKLSTLYDKPDGATRYLVGRPGEPAVEESLSHFDSGDPDALLDTVRWAFEQCPAQRYALILWSHGSGWRPEDRGRTVAGPFSTWSPEELTRIAQEVRGDDAVSAEETADRAAQPGSIVLFRTTLTEILQQDSPAERAICFDDGSGHSLDTLELERVVRETKSIIGQPLDLLGMDACVMANLEVAHQIREHVRTLVASEELVPGRSWPYDTILNALHDKPETSATDFASLVVQHYVDYYTTHPPALNFGDVTKAALDLTHLDDLTQAVDQLAEALLNDIEAHAGHLWTAQRETRAKETLRGRRWANKFNFHLWDLGTLAAHLAQQSPNRKVQDAACAVSAAIQPGGAVIAERHRGDWFDGIGGVSIYAVPPGVQRISPYYSELAMAQETHWNEMLQAYHDVLT